MAGSGKQKSGGGNKKHGRNKIKCQRYLNEHRRTKSKIAKFIKHNIAKDITEELKKKLIGAFKDLQEHTKKG